MQLPPKIRAVLINIAKNAINAGILSLAAVYHNSSQYNYHTYIGLWSIFKFIVVPAVLTREGMVYVPLVLKWTQTSDTTTP